MRNTYVLCTLSFVAATGSIPEMSEEQLSWLVVHSGTETLEVRQRFGVALPSLLGVAPDNLLEAGVLGHGQASP
jgi:hypothetical protein